MTTPRVESKTIRTAYVWTIAGHMTKNVVGFLISILLARFLTPAEYGLVGMVTVVIGILAFLQDFGLGQAVVYFPEEPDSLPTCFTVTIFFSTILTLLASLGAPLVANFYHEPRLTLILRVLSVNLILAGLRAVSQGLMSKRMQFRQISTLEGAGTILAGIVGVVMAWRGMGVWSLIANLILCSLIQTVLVCRVIRPRFSLKLNRPMLKKMLRWGLPVTGSGLLWQFYDNADYMVVGKLLGDQALGYYTMAFRLATMVNDKVSAVVNRVSFPSLSSMQDDPRRLLDHWFSITRKLALINFPILAALLLNGSDFILTFLKKQWIAAAAPLPFLCLIGAFKTIVPVANILLGVFGRTDRLFYFCLANSLMLPAAFVIGCKTGGIVGVGIAWCTVYPILGLLQIRICLKLGRSNMREFLWNLRFPLLVTATCFLAMLPVSALHWSPIYRLALRSAIGLTTYGAMVLSRKENRAFIRGFLEGNRKRTIAVSS